MLFLKKLKFDVKISILLHIKTKLTLFKETYVLKTKTIALKISKQKAK
jgi:hypothetical protein